MRTGILAAALSLAAVLAPHGSASAQTYPDRTVRIIIAFGAGGSIDTLGRIVAQKLSEAWGQSVVVENRAGGGGNIGAVAAAQSASDGYTLHLGAQTLAVNVTLAPMKGFDPVKDFEPVMLVASAQDVLLVPPASPFRSVKDLIDYARAHPGELNTGTLGPGSSSTLATLMFTDLVGIKPQLVPYSTPPLAATDLIAGRLAFLIPTLGAHVGNIQAGRVRALAVSGTVRAALFPEVPTFQELGVKFVDESSWYALFAPKGTPKEVIGKINADMTRILALPEVKARETALGYRFIGGPPARLAAFLESEIAKWAEVAKTASLVPQ